MGKDFLSYALLIAAAIVAYISVTDYLDRTMDNNFTTPTVSETNKRVVEELDGAGVEYSVGVQGVEEE